MRIFFCVFSRAGEKRPGTWSGTVSAAPVTGWARENGALVPPVGFAGRGKVCRPVCCENRAVPSGEEEARKRGPRFMAAWRRSPGPLCGVLAGRNAKAVRTSALSGTEARGRTGAVSCIKGNGEENARGTAGAPGKLPNSDRISRFPFRQKRETGCFCAGRREKFPAERGLDSNPRRRLQ